MKLPHSISSQISTISEHEFSSRRRSLAQKISGGVALITSGREITLSRDQHFAFRTDSNFAYLCGLREPDAILVLDARHRKLQTLLYLRERDLTREIWTGERIGSKRACKLFHIDEAKPIDRLSTDFPNLVKNAALLAFNPGINPELDAKIFSSFTKPISPSASFPVKLLDISHFTAEMRLIKSPREIALLRSAARTTAKSIELTIQDYFANESLRSTHKQTHFITERKFAESIEHNFINMGAQATSFHTIVAAGAHATCLHHQPTDKPFRRQELVLIDAGACIGDYSGDLTRVFPVSGKFSQAQSDVYSIVLAAMKAAISHSKPETTLKQIHHKAISVLLEGLEDLRIIKKRLSASKKLSTLSKYYMHNTSHYLGLDVHDISPLRWTNQNKAISPLEMPLKMGTVFTVEPGLYFPLHDPQLPRELQGIGIRLEDDILITADGHEILSGEEELCKW